MFLLSTERGDNRLCTCSHINESIVRFNPVTIYCSHLENRLRSFFCITIYTFKPVFDFKKITNLILSIVFSVTVTYCSISKIKASNLHPLYKWRPLWVSPPPPPLLPCQSPQQRPKRPALPRQPSSQMALRTWRSRA